MIERKSHRPTMLTNRSLAAIRPVVRTDLARFRTTPISLADAFARAWFKLTHRAWGRARAISDQKVPAEDLIWQDPIPASESQIDRCADIAALKPKFLASGLSVSELVSPHGVGVTSVAPTTRRRERRSYSSGAAKELGGQSAGPLTQGAQEVGRHQTAFNRAQSDGKKISLADLIVLGGVRGTRASGEERRPRC